ncbi:phytanoyl-CoA dioxygenase family protein [Candidatus Pelagibacter sp.]|nr:phytanoyl-CoA dioxygenase family protein [Candidatus Pelagibacter sp.]
MHNKFNKDGYIHIKNFHNNNYIDKFKNSFKNLCHYNQTNFISLKNNKKFNEKEINKFLINLKKNSPDVIKKIYTTSKHLSTFIQIFENKKIKNLCSKLLKTKSDNLIITDFQFRIDYPSDEKHTLKWHQDSSYYLQDTDGQNSLVCNVSLHNIKKNMGAVWIIPGSHKKRLKMQKKIGNKYKSGQREIIEKFNKRHAKQIETNETDVTIYHPNLIHKSGFNRSNKIRYSAIARVYNPLSKSFNNFEKYYKLIK